MIRKLVLSASAVALAAGGFGLASASSASAGITVTANSSSHLSCAVTAAVKLSPPLKDDWVPADHASDPNTDVQAITAQNYPAAGPVTVKVKGTATSCSGVVTDGTNPTTVTKITVSLTNDPAHLGSTDPATCIGLFHPTGPPSTATYDAILKYTASPYKVTPTTITNATIAPGSFTTSGGVITGSFAGGTSTTTGVPDGVLGPMPGSGSGTYGIGYDELFGPAPDGTTVATSSAPAAPNVCQPAVKIKTGKHPSATPVKPKGMKSIGIVAGSTLVIHG